MRKRYGRKYGKYASRRRSTTRRRRNMRGRGRMRSPRPGKVGFRL